MLKRRELQKDNIKVHATLTLFAPYGICGLALSFIPIAYRVIVDKNIDKWESIPRFAIACSFFGPFSPIYSIPYTLFNLRLEK